LVWLYFALEMELWLLSWDSSSSLMCAFCAITFLLMTVLAVFHKPWCVALSLLLNSMHLFFISLKISFTMV
jgi:hypothetical protein